MKKERIWHKIKFGLNALNLTDKCLLIFMTILMLQSMHNLFYNEVIAEESSSIDVIVRTMAAAIFGYFISSNFQSTNENIRTYAIGKPIDPLSDTQNKPIAEIGFKADLKNLEATDVYDKGSLRDPILEQRNKLQIIVIASIGIFALLLLIITRDFLKMPAASTATISQLRDFVSGSIGFLIGHPTYKKKSS